MREILWVQLGTQWIYVGPVRDRTEGETIIATFARGWGQGEVGFAYRPPGIWLHGSQTCAA